MKVEFKTDNQIFEDEDCKKYEILRILEDIAFKVKKGKEYGKIMDINGNNIGEWEV